MNYFVRAEKSKFIYLIFSLWFFVLGNDVVAEAQDDRIQSISIEAPSLLKSVIPNKPQQDLVVILPTDYHVNKKSYPVLYYLHGYGGRPSQAKVLAPYSQNFIVVGINGYNKFAGSFYANSVVTGNWEDFVIKDTINFIDSNYRTIKSAKGRGIAGFSMGGVAAINIALKHPEIYQSLFALSPAAFGRNGMDKAVKHLAEGGWTRLLDGYAATFAPKVDGSDLPWHAWDAKNEKIRTMWDSGWGNWKTKIGNYAKGETHLARVRIEYGKYDKLPWIPEGALFVANMLKNRGQTIEIVDHNGGHDLKPLQAQNIANFFDASFK